jgi:DNA-binding NarL/FixJ family response regulator
MRAYYFTADLFFSSRVVGVAERMGVDLRVVGSLEQFLQSASDVSDCRLAILDLTLPKLDLQMAVETVRAQFPQAHVVAYGPHVQEAALAAASAAGCDAVLSRGQFNANTEQVLRLALNDQGN